MSTDARGNLHGTNGRFETKPAQPADVDLGACEVPFDYATAKRLGTEVANLREGVDRIWAQTRMVVSRPPAGGWDEVGHAMLLSTLDHLSGDRLGNFAVVVETTDRIGWPHLTTLEGALIGTDDSSDTAVAVIEVGEQELRVPVKSIEAIAF